MRSGPKLTSHDLPVGNEESQAGESVAKVKFELGTLVKGVQRVTATPRCSTTMRGTL